MQTTKTGLPGLDFRDRTVRADFAMPNFSFHFRTLTNFKRAVAGGFLVRVFLHQALPLGQNGHLVKQFCYESCLHQVIHILRYFNTVCNNDELKNYTFANFFGYIALWFVYVYAPYMLNFLYSQFQSCS